MNIPERFWRMLTVLTVALVVLSAVFIVKELKAIGYVGANPTQTNTITVSGTGDSVAVPDIATFSFSVTESEKTVAEAQTKATTKINAALAELKVAGIADKDISTDSYNINPHYEYQNSVCPANAGISVVYCPAGKSTLTGYEVSQTIRVKVRDITKAGTIFTSIGALGVQNVNGLTFSVDNPDSVQAEARSEAIDKAKTKANALAKQLGVHLVGITNFSEDYGSYPRPVMYSMASDKAVSGASVATPPSIPTGEQKVTSNVTITYEIK